MSLYSALCGLCLEEDLPMMDQSKGETMNVSLYHKWSCPYSAKVRDFIEEHHLKDEINYIDRDESEKNKQRLKDLTGKTQVPCLVIDGSPMHESDEIIQWLRERFLEGGKEASL